jgi:hypothetical protein
MRLRGRIDRIERQLKLKLAARRCPVCLDQNVWRLRINGERQMEKDDRVYDDTWHCRRCGTAAPEVNVVSPAI